MNLELICQRWLEAAFNGVLQGILLTVFVALGFRCFPRTNAATRHAVWFMTLLCVTSLPLLQGLRATRDGSGANGVALVNQDSGDASKGCLSSGVDSLNRGGDQGGSGEMNLPEEGGSTSIGVPKEWSPAIVDPEAPSGVATPIVPARRPWEIQLPNSVPVAVVGAWILLASLRVVRLIHALGWVCRLKAHSLPPGMEAQRLFGMLRESMGVGRRIRLRVGPEECIPLLAGFLEPAVIVPAGFLETGSSESIAQVLRHELGHVRRYDDWSNLVQQVIAAVYFFHPAVHWISRKLALDREIACDDHVLDANSGVRSYALLLTHFAGRKPGRDWIAAPAVWSRNTELKERIAMILNPKRNSSLRIAGTTVGILLVVTAGFAGALLHAGPRVEVTESFLPPSGVGGEDATTDAAVADPAKESVPPAVSADSRGSSSSETLTQPSDPTEPHESGLTVAPKPRKARPPKKVKSFEQGGEEFREERMPDDSLEERLARLERTLEEMKLSLKSRLSDAQRTSRSPDLNLNINREEIEKKVAEGQRRLQAAALALAGRQEGLRTQDDARREAERQFELAWKLNGDRLTGRLGDLEGVLGMKTGTLDAERRRLEAVRQALEKELKRIDERIVRLKERQAGGAVEPDTKGALPGEPGTLQSDTQERNADGNSPVGR